jgi:hypothetical protein
MHALTYNDHLFANSLFKQVKNLLLVCLLFMVTANKLIAIPLDKIAMPLFILLYATFHLSSLKVNIGELTTLVIYLVCCSLSIAANFFVFNPIIFFPPIGLIFAFIIARHPAFLQLFYKAILIHIFISFFLWLDSYIHGVNDYVISLANKGMPFVNSALGLTATGQTFGTLCITGLILYYYRKDEKKPALKDRLAYILITVGIFIAINRVTFIVYLFILLVKDRKLFLIYLFITLGVALYFISVINSLFLDKGTIDSRSQLLEGFNISFWQRGNLLIWIFGRANNQVNEEIIRHVTWDERFDIENGHAMLLHTYGFLGYITYMLGCAVFTVRNFFLKRKWYECILVILYLFLVPYFTQEFVSTTFYIILAVFLSRMDWYQQKQKDNGEPDSELSIG